VTKLTHKFCHGEKQKKGLAFLKKTKVGKKERFFFFPLHTIKIKIKMKMKICGRLKKS
jgi:hypothetical protein